MLDACAIIAYLWDEAGADRVEERLEDHYELCMAHPINLCEVYYKARRLTDEGEVLSAIRDLKAKGLVVRENLDEAFWLEVGKYKAAM